MGIAFVRENSPLVMRLKEEKGIDINTSLEDTLIKKIKSLGRVEIDEDISSSLLNYGFWTLLPVSAPLSITDFKLGGTKMIPKWSPRSFFSSKYALYCEPHVWFQDVSRLVQSFEAENNGDTPV